MYFFQPLYFSFAQRLQTLSPNVNALFFSTAFFAFIAQSKFEKPTGWNKENFILYSDIGFGCVLLTIYEFVVVRKKKSMFLYGEFILLFIRFADVCLRLWRVTFFVQREIPYV